MISFKQYLAEIFDNPYDFGKSGNGRNYVFQVNGKTYGMRFNDINPFGDYEIDFFVGGPGKAGYALQGNTKEAIRIYSTLIAISRDFIRNNKFRSFTFIPDNARTVSIYTKYAKWLVKETRSKFVIEHDPFHDAPMFLITKN